MYNVYASKDTTKKVKRQSTELEHYLLIMYLVICPVSRILKNIYDTKTK